jgi:glycosyltransferase involved in cell wall biosynthesis
VRLLFVNPNHSPAYGGVERWMIETASGLVARGHTATLFGRPGAPWLVAAEGAGLPVREGIHGAWFQRVLRLRAAIRAERPDLVIVKGTKGARFAAWARSGGSRARVVMFLGATHELAGARWIYRYTWRQVDAGIVVAHGAARWYLAEGFGPAEKLHVLWKGVDLARFDAACVHAATVRAQLGLAGDDVAVGMIGRLAWQKGIDDLLAAVRIVRTEPRNLRFFIVGGGSDAADFAAAVAAPELAGRVTLLGQRDDVPELLGAMDIVVQSSRREVMAQATLEGMAAGRAVVSTRTVGADEAIDDGISGILVPVADPPALARALRDLARDPARRAALGAAARARISAEFTAEKALDRCEAILRIITGNAEGRSRSSDHRHAC